MGLGYLTILEHPTVAIQVRQDRLGDLERTEFRLNQRGLKRISVTLTPKTFVADDCDLAEDAVDRVKIELDPNLFKDVRVPCVGTSFFLHVTKISAPRTVEGFTMVEEKDTFGIILTFCSFAVTDCSIHLTYLLCFH